MKRWMVILAAALIFVSGIATGAFALRAANNRARAAREAGMAGSLMDPRFDALKRMQQELALTREQTERIDAILQDGRKRTHQIWETCQPLMREEMKKVRERIQAELRPDQHARFEELIKRSKERRGPRPDGEGRGAPWHRSERDTNAPAVTSSP